ncbi:MAG: ParB N-terminal domain-containing protein [Planctomycetia bacterium]|nr:ParB N-terminal domain-containing protein [Planctomycetia bacterium]
MTTQQKNRHVCLDDISLDGGTQPRPTLSIEIVAEYKAAMEAGAKFPPLVVFLDGRTFWLADGFHRFHAERERGAEKVLCEIHLGTVRDAKLYAAGANAQHGLRRTNTEKRHAVKMLLEDREWAKRSDRWIADRCAVSQPFVGTVRSELKTVISPNREPQAARIGRDGKERSLPTKAVKVEMTESETIHNSTQIKEPPPEVVHVHECPVYTTNNSAWKKIIDLIDKLEHTKGMVAALSLRHESEPLSIEKEIDALDAQLNAFQLCAVSLLRSREEAA